MKNVPLLLSLFIFGGLLCGEAFATDPNLLVEFRYRGQKISIQGEKLKGNTFLFNKGAKKKIWISTLDWTPYIGKDICKQGWVQQFAVALFVSQGYEVKSTFYPWARTISVVETGTADILYPEWYIENTAPSDVNKGTKRRDNLALSDRFPGGPIAFMKRKGEPDHYKGNFQNLKNEKITVVRGYQHTPEFDRLMDQGFFKIHKAVDDLMQARLLSGERVNLLINDPFVVRFTIANSELPQSEKRRLLNDLEVVHPIIQYNYLYFAISKKKPNWQFTLDVVNNTIQEFEATGLVFQIIKDTLQACDLNLEETFSPYQNAQMGLQLVKQASTDL